jgi:hypothetical protein
MDAGEPPEFAALLDSLNGARPVGPQRALFLAAYTEAPDGFAQVVAQSKAGKAPLGLLTRLVQADAHLQVAAKQPRRKAPPPCPECEVGGGRHVEGCSLAGVAS